MKWSRKIAKPIALRDGRKIESLRDARTLMFSLPASPGEGALEVCRRASLEGGRPRREIRGHGCEGAIRTGIKGRGAAMTPAALGVALDVALKRVAELSGDEALNLESLRDFGRKT
jgi:hypothetical protein